MKKIDEKKKGLFRYIKLRTLIIAVVLLVFNSYAWFIYATKASIELNVHVSSWNVDFKIDGETSSTNIIVDVGKIYPGMPAFSKEIVVKNNGEMKAKLLYEYASITVFGETFKVGEEGVTQETLKNKIENEYPFKTVVSSDASELESGQGAGKYTITITWPYESGDDTTDTYWGQKAYDFYEENGDDSTSLSLVVKLIAEQIN